MSRAPVRVLIVALALVLGGSLARAEDGTGSKPVEPTTLDELRQVLTDLATRLGRLIEIAERDPRNDIVDLYLAQDEEAFKDRGRVKAKDLVEIMEDEDASPGVRVRARDALASNGARTYDPDLLVERGQTKPRNKFCQRYLVPLLKRDDPTTRTLSQELLLLYFREGQKDPSIGMFKPESATKGQRDRASKAWTRFLRK